jgi:hypothetical protein
MKIYKLVQKVLVRYRQMGDLISLLSFLESRLKNGKNVTDSAHFVNNCWLQIISLFMLFY